MARGFSRGGDSRPLVIGHRGVRRDGFVENTMPAFEQAVIEGAEAIELDVRVCATGELVVFHDPTLERITEKADDRAIADLPWEELSRVELPLGTRVPLLSEVLAFARGARVPVNVEMKRDAPSRTDVVRATARLLDRWDPAHGIIVSSFDPPMMAMIAMMAPHVPRAMLVHRTWYTRVHTAAAIPVRAEAIHLCRTVTRPEVVRSLVDRGYLVNVWTVNDAIEARDLAALGVTGIITDTPAEIVAALG